MGIRKDKLKYMFNDIKIGPVTFHMYGLMIAIGFAAALMMCLKRGKKRGLNEDIIYGISVSYTHLTLPTILLV